MTSSAIGGHPYAPPAGVPVDYAGACTECGYGLWAPHHNPGGDRGRDRFVVAVREVAERIERIHRARELAEEYRQRTTDETARAGFGAIAATLADRAHIDGRFKASEGST